MTTETFKQLFRISIFSVLFVGHAKAQGLKDFIGRHSKDLKIKTVTFGPYLEAEKGKYFLLELGCEAQLKSLKLNASTAHGISGGLNYDFKSSNIGFDLGYWYRPRILGFTFGGNLGLRSDLSSTSSFGISPTIGYKFWLLHAQAGFYVWTVKPSIMYTNTVFVTLKFAPVYAKKRSVNRGKKGFFNSKN
jgi:hypothetical protein